MVSLFKKRVLAYLTDWFVISAVLNIFTVIFYYAVQKPFSIHTSIFNYFLFLLPVFIIFYFVLLEKKKGTTIGKDILDLKVVSQDGKNISYREAIIRNLSKLYWIPIIFDVIIGKFVKGPNERILGQWSKTMVVEVGDFSKMTEMEDKKNILKKRF